MKPEVGKIPVETEEGKVGATKELPVGATGGFFDAVGATAAGALDPSDEDPAATKPDVWAVAPAAVTGSSTGVWFSGLLIVMWMVGDVEKEEKDDERV